MATTGADMLCFEQGPIRPPSEAGSLLIRVSRNCPWNKCAFCPVYKGAKFELRDARDVIGDIVSMRKIYDILNSDSITGPDVQRMIKSGEADSMAVSSILNWMRNGAKTVFLQDGDALVQKADKVIEILRTIRKELPWVERVTTYGRSKKLAYMKPEEVRSIAEAGLNRVHIGLETGNDEVGKMMNKGSNAEEHVRAGRAVKDAGMELSEYVILGLGGEKLWREHATDTAKVINQVNPDFIRVRTLAIAPGTPLWEMKERGEFKRPPESVIVAEERLLIEKFENINSRFVSDHILNLLEEVEGKLMKDKEKMLGILDRYMGLPTRERTRFMIGRRAGIFRRLDDLEDPQLAEHVDEVCMNIARRFGAKLENEKDVETLIEQLVEQFI
jgi:biotin synthase-like enzyme